ncbi:hypothetical protein I302_101275 [Kwoniella bestiolae CBS 10118]|uniref:Uncharacterized protein n=1 Tax=Kwoniella bestiolae CBS 10118 TaxID=1296100 RepID=A0A1B9G7F7_9TREE|nr:hypothetical protein I302_04649 [Kwoniella bestiolae CBS 10118]OCF26958.1 hypothetical protein I302_04649 [Kwoniella bestiolae CBS 10118]
MAGISMTTFLPGNTHITLLSTSLLCCTSYLLHINRPTHVPYQFLLNFINAVSISAYVPLILVKLFEGFKAFVWTQITLPTSRNHKKGRRESVWRRWMNNSEFLLCLTIFQFALACGFIALSLLSTYTLHSPTPPFSSLHTHAHPHTSNEPSKTYISPSHRPSTPTTDLTDLLALLISFTHFILLAIQLLSFALIILEIRTSSRYSTVDRSLAGLLERDINDLISLKNEYKFSSKRWAESAFTPTHGRSSSIAGMYSSPSRDYPGNGTGNEEGDGTPRRRSISTNSTLVSTPMGRERDVEGDIRFSDPFGRRSSRNGNTNGNGTRRVSVRFDLSQQLHFSQPNQVGSKKYVVTPGNYDEESTISPSRDYFSLPYHSTVPQREVIRPIPLSIIKSPKESIGGCGFSPSSNGSETLEDIVEEEAEEDMDMRYRDGGNGRERRDSWMDVRGEQSV